MTLYTKSIQEKKKKEDGIRICIMRSPNKDADFDIWVPVLAPSRQLLTDIHTAKISKAEYIKRFTQEVLSGQNFFLGLLTEIALKHKVTILCWEENPKGCHRKLVAKAAQKINPKLRVVIK